MAIGGKPVINSMPIMPAAWSFGFARNRVTSALFEDADRPVVDGLAWKRTGEVRLLGSN